MFVLDTFGDIILHLVHELLALRSSNGSYAGKPNNAEDDDDNDNKAVIVGEFDLQQFSIFVPDTPNVYQFTFVIRPSSKHPRTE